MTFEIPAKVPMGNGMEFDFHDAEVQGPEHAGFAEKVREAVATLEGSAAGAEMMRQIRQARAAVKVFAGLANTCVLTRASDADLACCRESLDDGALRAKLEALLVAGRGADPEVKRALDKAAKLGAVPARSAEGGKPSMPRFACDRRQRGTIAHRLRDHLTPGDGAEARVRWNPALLKMGDEVKDAAWNERPPWLALGHELVHGWRMVTGRVAFHPALRDSYYEEAMTVGLPPYDGCAFTENRYRLHHKEPRRSFYGPSTEAKTAKAAKKHEASPDFQP